MRYVTANKNAKNEYVIPVTWEVFDKVSVQANSLEEAYEYVNNNADIIPLGDEPEYLDGSYQISADNIDDCKLYNRNNVGCKEFECVDDLSQYTDSMLFPSGTNLATGTFFKDGNEVHLYLDVRGEVSVRFKDDVYHDPTEFPDELINLIKKNPNNWMYDTEDVYVGLNNWFEVTSDEDPIDGFVYGGDPSEESIEDVLDFMKDCAESYFEILAA